MAQQQEIRLYAGTAPGSETWKQKEVEYRDGGGRRMVRNVVAPTLTVFLPEKATGPVPAVVVCAGGGFHFHSWDSEGIEVAKWLQARGVAAFVLKYRLLDTGATPDEFSKHLDVLFGKRATAADPADTAAVEREKAERAAIAGLAAEDGRQAVALVKRRCAEWNLRPDKIGILGFSAGAAVTMGVVMNHDAASRPDFAAPIYGGNTGGKPVPTDAMPLFILVADDDVPNAIGSAKLYSEWKSAGKSAELHIYSKGGHGFGMNKRGLPVDSWIERFGDWLQTQVK
jgi:acetyl esterase/lipase